MRRDEVFWRRLVIIIASLNLVPATSLELCVQCQCITKYFPSPLSLHFTDITCNASSTNTQIDFNEIRIDENVQIRDLTISGFDKVVLNTKFLFWNDTSQPPLLQRNINVGDVSELVIESWSSFTNYSLINITNINFQWDLTGEDTELDSLFIKNSTIMEINPGNMYFKAFREKVILVDVNIQAVRTDAVHLHSNQPSSTFLLAQSKIGKDIKQNGVDVRAGNIVISKCRLDGSTRHIKLNGTNKIVLTKNRIEQLKKHRDFFNLFSPSIVLIKNIINTYVNNTVVSRING